MCNNYIPVERGHWYRQELNEIVNEFHYLFKCHCLWG